MGNEIEAKYINIDKDEIRKKLAEIGAVLTKPECKMRRVVFDTGPHSFARVRDEGNKIVMTYKNFLNDEDIMGCKEVNLEIDNYANGVLFLKGCGLEQKALQETFRELWVFEDVEIGIDTWPWIPTFIEIEGASEASVWKVANLLGFDKKDALTGAVDRIYNHYYGVDMDVVNYETPVINFEIEPPEWAKNPRQQ